MRLECLVDLSGSADLDDHLIFGVLQEERG